MGRKHQIILHNCSIRFIMCKKIGTLVLAKLPGASIVKLQPVCIHSTWNHNRMWISANLVHLHPLQVHHCIFPDLKILLVHHAKSCKPIKFVQNTFIFACLIYFAQTNEHVCTEMLTSVHGLARAQLRM